MPEEAKTTQTALQSIKNQRRGHRGFVNQVIKKISDVINSDEYQDVNNSKIQLLSSKETLRQKMETLTKLHENALDLITEQGLVEEEIVDDSTFKMTIQENIVKIDQWISECESKEIVRTTDNRRADPNSKIKSARLPKLELKRFGGDPLEWYMFWDTFESAIDKNEGLDDVSKFSYLKSVLDGKAADCVKGLALTASNYMNAVELLRDRFADPQVVITANMDVLISLEAVTSAKDITSLRKLFDKIEIHARNLNIFDVNAEHYGPILISIIMNKLPDEIRLDISRNMPTGKWKLIDLLAVFSAELSSREKCVSMSSKERTGVQDSSEKQSEFSATALHVGRKNEYKVTCSYCKSNHPSYKCQVVTDVSARKSILQRNKKCFNCLRPSHIARDCAAATRCYTCGGKHHSSI